VQVSPLMRSGIVALAILAEAASLASCGSAAVPAPMDLRVHISEAGKCSVPGHEEVPCGGLGGYVKALNAQSSCDILIVVDRESQYAFVEAALSSLQKAGFKRVGFVNDNQ
jgi:biopolymer transport protein ExbD